MIPGAGRAGSGSGRFAYSLLIAFVLIQILIGYGIAGALRQHSSALEKHVLDIMMLRCNHQCMRTTLTLDEDVYAKIEAEARRSGRSYKEVVNDLLRQALALRFRPQKPARFKVRGRPLGRRPGLNYDNIGELLEQLEGPAHR